MKIKQAKRLKNGWRNHSELEGIRVRRLDEKAIIITSDQDREYLIGVISSSQPIVREALSAIIDGLIDVLDTDAGREPVNRFVELEEKGLEHRL